MHAGLAPPARATSRREENGAFIDETAHDIDAYYRRSADGTYAATRATESPWSRTQQHGGPPLALAAYEMLRAHPSDDRRPVSVSLDFLGAIPLSEVTIATSVVRPGKRIDLLAATMSTDGRPFAEVRMWRALSDPALAVPGTEPGDTLTIPEPQPQRFFDGLERWGYGESIDWRFVTGGTHVLGPASVWTRVRSELVSGEGIDPHSRALVIADSANGISAILPMREWLFVPTRIVVTFARDPIGDWIRIDAATHAGPDGRAICRASMYDEHGLTASVDQAVFVARR